MENIIDLDIPQPVETVEFPESQAISRVRSNEGVQDKIAMAKFVSEDLDENLLAHQYENNQDHEVDAIVGDKLAKEDMKQKEQLITEMIDMQDPNLGAVVQSMTVPSFEEFSRNAVVKDYARKLTETVAGNSFDFAFEVNNSEKAESAHTALDITERWLQVSSHIRDRVDIENELWNQKTLAGKAGSFAWGLIPILDTYATHDALDGAPTSSIMKGNNIEEQVRWLWLQDPDDIPALLDEAIEDVRSFAGDLAALNYAQLMLTLSSSDKFMENTFGVLDIVTSGLVGGAAKLGKATVSAATRLGPKTSKVASKLGENELSAITHATERNLITEGVNKADDLEPMVPKGSNPQAILGQTDTTAGTSGRKLLEAAHHRQTFIEKALDEGQVLSTLNKTEVVKLAAREFDNIRKFHSKSKDTVIDYDILAAEDTPDNIDKIVVKFGKTDGTGFATEQAAKSFASRWLQFKDPVITQGQGSKYFLEVTKPIKQDEVLDNIEISLDQQTPSRTGFLRALHSDGYIASLDHIKDKRTVSDISELVGRYIEEIGDPIRSMGKKKFREFDEALQDAIITDKEKGNTWMSLAEWNDHYKTLHNKAPTFDQQDAYVAYRQMYDFDYSMRELSTLKAKSRLGVENFEVKGIPTSFEGVQKNTIPFGDADYFSVVALDEKGKILVRGTNRSSAKKQKEFQDLLDDNYVLVESFNGFTELQDGVNATFVLSRNLKRDTLKFGQNVGYNPGGHRITKSPFFIKQGMIKSNSSGQRIYTGDLTAFNVRSQEQGKEIVQTLEQARQIKQSGNDEAFQMFVANKLPELTKKDIDRFDWNQPFMVTKSGQRVGYQQGVHYDLNALDNKFNISSRLSGRFMGERDEQVVDAILSERDGNTIRIEPARTIRPVEALNIGLRDAMNQHTMTEFISKSVDNILREFGDVFEDSSNAIRRNPIAFLNNPDKFNSNVTRHQKATVERLVKALNHFLGTPTEASKIVQNTKEAAVEWALGRFGVNSKIPDILEERLLHTASDPATYFRGVAFHSKMGLFNPKQLFLQSQVLVQTAGIGGVRDTLASLPAIMYSRSLALTANPKMLNAAAENMTKFGWKKEHFKESHEALAKSGWDIVGGSVASRDLYEGPNLTRGVVGKTLEHGTLPFKTGEKIGRVTAWHVAYRNWRKANPTAKFDREAISDVRLRASDLTSNMTRDMNALWQRGLLSVPTQFWGFQARVFEQMVSPASRLTGRERARLFAAFSTMYGVPVGLGAATMVWPVNESVKKYLMETGMDETVENSFVLETLRDGIIATAIEMVTGSDFDTGNFGPAGNPVFKDAFRFDKEWYELFGGASAGIIAHGVSEGTGVVKGVYYMSQGFDLDPDNPFPVSAQDVIDVFRPISSVNNTAKIWAAANTGKWMSGNQTYLGDISLQEALVSGIVGLEKEDITDTFLRLESAKDVKNLINTGRREVQKQYSIARQALDRGDMDSYSRAISKAKALGVVYGLTPRDMSNSASRGFTPESLEDASQERLDNYVKEFYKRRNRGQ